MPLNERELLQLLDIVRNTQAAEIDCDECLMRVSEFAESQLAGKPVSETLAAVEQHLAICVECREEFDALRRAIQGMGPGGRGCGEG